MQKNRGQSSWISLSDLMTGLMLVFLIIVVLMQHQQYTTLVRYENTKKEIYDDLNEKFAREKNDKKVTISEDLVVRFLEPDTLFEENSTKLSRDYEKFLDGFIPKYLDILLDKKYSRHIREVRIEGHTGKPTSQYPNYINLVRLSQSRAHVILQYFISNKVFQRLDKELQEKLQFQLTANGFGNGRMIDHDGKYVRYTKKSPFNTRRVEFRIMTDAGKSLDTALENIRTGYSQ